MLKTLRFFNIEKHCACVQKNEVIKKRNISIKMAYSEYIRTARTRPGKATYVPVVIPLQLPSTSF